MSDYPEHDKLTVVAAETQAAGEFIEWLGSQGVCLMIWREDLTDMRVDDYCPTAKYSHEHCAHWGADDAAHKCCRCNKPYGLREITGLKAWTSPQKDLIGLLAEWSGIDQKRSRLRSA